jgi:hypothetical protein
MMPSLVCTRWHVLVPATAARRCPASSRVAAFCSTPSSEDDAAATVPIHPE